MPFAPMNRAYADVFKPDRLTIGLAAPLEDYMLGERPTLAHHIARAQLADRLGFAALWLRDIPFDVPTFGDVGQTFDPFVYLGALAMVTQNIALGVGSVILPLRHPAHVAKAAASADQLSNGRLILGVASGDRPEEYPAMAIDYDTRGQRFVDSMAYMRACFEDRPELHNSFGHLNGRNDMLPKPTAGRIPMLITGGASQPPEWGARHGDGWITYPRNAANQREMVDAYRARVAAAGDVDKPVMQSLYIDLHAKADAPPRPIHLGFACGVNFLLEYLREIEALGVNHVLLNLRFNNADIEGTMDRLADEVLPAFAD